MRDGAQDSVWTVGARANGSMVCDFFYPQPGGIESHIYHLSQRLVELGNRVIVVTHAYEDRSGIRYLTGGIKVYYVPFVVVHRESTFPTVFSFFPVLRSILLRERITIVHGHGSMSNFCHEALLHARTLGLKTCFTEHSLFGFADAGSILTNKLVKFTLSDVDHVICVSHTCKENTVLRASLDPYSVSVIPNALVSSNFTPASEPPPLEPITIVVVSRLYYNKGADLLTAIIPRVLEAHPNVRFVIAGSGPKAIDLEQMRERHMIQDKVEMLGTVRHDQVRDVMVKGHIYLHPSLTEAFGTVLIEAASCGLYVVCTRVGGVPEVLPGHMTSFAKPEEDDLLEALNSAIRDIASGKMKTVTFHEEVQKMYSWRNVAERTCRIYDEISSLHQPSLLLRLKRYYGCGMWAGKLFCFWIAFDYLLMVLLEWLYPATLIDRVKPLKFSMVEVTPPEISSQSMESDEMAQEQSKSGELK